MRKRTGTKLLAIILACAAYLAPLPTDAAQARGRSRTSHADAGVSREQPEFPPGRGRGNASRIYQDPASSKGYEAGYDLGLLDGRDGERYDPVRHRDYRDGDRGYATGYGSRDGYKTKFRTGFRQGYEDGYRDGTRTRK